MKLFVATRNLARSLDYYSHFNPSPLSIKQFIDFGKFGFYLSVYCTCKTCRVYENDFKVGHCSSSGSFEYKLGCSTFPYLSHRILIGPIQVFRREMSNCRTSADTTFKFLREVAESRRIIARYRNKPIKQHDVWTLTLN